MSASTAELNGRERGISGQLLGMVLFVTSETMFFGALFGAYFTIRSGSLGRGESWPPGDVHLHLGLPLVLTLVLVSSSVTVHMATHRLKHGDGPGFKRWLQITIGLGVLFLAGQLLDYALLDFALGDNAFTTLFFTLTGFHGLHVAIGVVILGVALISARRGRLHPARRGIGDAAAFYWHFVDLVWIALFATLYLFS